MLKINTNIKNFPKKPKKGGSPANDKKRKTTQLKKKVVWNRPLNSFKVLKKATLVENNSKKKINKVIE